MCHGDASKIVGAKVVVCPKNFGFGNGHRMVPEKIFPTVCESLDFSTGSFTLHGDYPAGDK